MKHLRIILCVLIAFIFLWTGIGLGEQLKHQDLQDEFTAQHGDILTDISTASATIQAEVAAQHSITQGNIQSDIADVKADIATLQATVDALEPGEAAPPCGAETENDRFVLQSGGTEVCDNNTGLVWQQTPSTDDFTQASAINHCPNDVGPDYFLPEAKDMVTLLDQDQISPAFPAGHPFAFVGFSYWTSDILLSVPTMGFFVQVTIGKMDVIPNTTLLDAWCVRNGS